MNNQKIIAKLDKAVICFRKKANELIDRDNIPWKVDMPDDGFGIAQVQYSDKKITIDLSQLNTVTLDACDSVTGVKKTYMFLAFEVNTDD